MTQPIAFTLRQVSAVLVSASAIDPQSILPEILGNANVVPADWTPDSGINTPFGALTQYQNGVTIRTDGNRCLFQQPIDGGLRDSYEIFPTAQRYAAAAMLVPYNAIGLNWSLIIPVGQPELWIREKLMGNASNLLDFSPASLRMTKQLDFAVCTLALETENARITIDFNYHFPLAQSSIGRMSEILNNWHLCQEHLTEFILSQF